MKVTFIRTFISSEEDDEFILVTNKVRFEMENGLYLRFFTFINKLKMEL